MQESLGNKLRVLRAKRQMSLRQAAARAGLAKETISEIERGLSHPHDVTLAKLARAYDVPVEELLKLEEQLALPLGEDEAPASPAEVPPLRLEWMYDAGQQARQRALEAATDQEIAGYVGEIDRAIALAVRAIPEHEREGKSKPDLAEVSNAAILTLERYIGHLAMLREEAEEATPNAAPPPSQHEVAELVLHV